MDVATIKSYKPETSSLSSGQVLKEPYTAEKGKLIVREMTELLVLDLVRKAMVTKQMTLTIGYDRTSIKCEYQGKTPQDSIFTVVKTGKRYAGKVGSDMYGRSCPKHAHGTGNLDHWTSSTAAIMDTMMTLFDRIVDKDLMIRRVNITACNLIPEDEIPEEAPEQLNLFVNYEAMEREKSERNAAEERERRIQRVTLQIQERFGKNSLLKGMNLLDGGTTRERNEQIGGHRAGSDTLSSHSSPKNAEDSHAPDSPQKEGDCE